MRFEKTFSFEAPRHEVWRLLSHTDKLNREMGLPPVQFKFHPREVGGANITATLQFGGLALSYVEHPFEWVKPAYFREKRTFFKGPIREVRLGVDLEEAGAGTEMRVWGEFDPSSPAGYLVCQAAGRKMMSDFLSVCRRFSAYLSHRLETPYPAHSRQSPPDVERLTKAVGRLSQLSGSQKVVESLKSYIETAPPEDVVQIRPFQFAADHNHDRYDTLRTMLLAANREVGLLDLRWRILCPSCRSNAITLKSLSEVQEGGHCESCNIRYDASFDQSVEALFGVTASIRPVHVNTYCVGGPGLTPHRIAQWVLAPGEERETTCLLAPGNYAFGCPQGGSLTPFLVRDGGATTSAVSIDNGTLRLSHDSLAPGCCLQFENQLPEEALLRIEEVEWTPNVVSAALVTSLQEFREQFSSEVLTPGTELSVEQVCILFSDLKGSTEMYRELGDAPSYRRVRDHFDQMRSILSKNNGSVVKTIGDAVMASFNDPADGLAAALEIQDTYRAHSDIVVKLGLHWGPAIVVNANDRLDYFGQTVNLAARLQGESLGGDIVLAQALLTDAQTGRALQGRATDSFEAELRGLGAVVKMVRITPSESQIRGPT